MDKNSRWYKDIQVLYDVAKKYGEIPVKNDDAAINKIYDEVKAIADKSNKFVHDILLAFMCQKKREWEGD